MSYELSKFLYFYHGIIMSTNEMYEFISLQLSITILGRFYTAAVGS